jgi:hypothetical protein
MVLLLDGRTPNGVWSRKPHRAKHAPINHAASYVVIRGMPCALGLAHRVAEPLIARSVLLLVFPFLASVVGTLYPPRTYS